MKKLLAIIMVVLMVLSFAACGSDSGSDDGSDNGGKAAVTDGSDLGMDMDAAGVQKMSDDRASKAKLLDTRDVWLEGRFTFVLDEDKKTYADFAEYIGCNAAEYEYVEEDMERRYTWIAEEDETAKFLAVFVEGGDGNWYLYSVGSTNLG